MSDASRDLLLESWEPTAVHWAASAEYPTIVACYWSDDGDGGALNRATDRSKVTCADCRERFWIADDTTPTAPQVLRAPLGGKTQA